jgi:CxxC motif-containing protein (DUF1111 family)
MPPSANKNNLGRRAFVLTEGNRAALSSLPFYRINACFEREWIKPSARVQIQSGLQVIFENIGAHNEKNHHSGPVGRHFDP